MKRNQIKNIIFDFGGVLVDWNPRHLYLKVFEGDVQKTEEFLNEVKFYSWNLRADHGESFESIFSDIKKTKPELEKLARVFLDRFIESIKGPIQGSVDVLERLHLSKIPLYGLTNWSSETFPKAKAHFKFFSIFKDILVSGDEKLLKPDPKFYQLAQKKFNLNPSETLFIDDKKENVVAAENEGFKGHHFLNPEGLEADLKSCGLL